MSQSRDRAERRCRIAVAGSGSRGTITQSALRASGFTDLVMLDRPFERVHYDDDSDTWQLTTADAEQIRADVAVAADRPVQRPWLPPIPGRDDFGGASFHSAAWDRGFDPSGKHIAVVGTDASAGHHLGWLVQPAASVTVFAHAPRRIVTDVQPWSTRAALRLRRRTRSHPMTIAASAIDAVTASGVRTVDGVDHRADAIIYGTGFFIPGDVADDILVGTAGVTIRQAWHDGMEPFCGISVRGFPNYFFITGPDPAAQARYVCECLKAMERTASGRIEVRASSQQVYNERAQLRPVAPPPVVSAFDLSGSAPAREDAYDGAATLEIAGTRHAVRVRLTGHLDPIDGHYHWQGTVFGSASDPLSGDVLKRARTGTLTVGERSARARIVEETPWGTHSVAGVGAPPYALSNH
ncbi:DUF4873 domain-containing protein [Mycobacterium sp. 94-17]|uniref:DUF4873 domain-containing protein n=1 Tax=Mycobacterium sp. 94-17 TaxID=2986147 RepID=UPI002D1E81C5|nr:DUF4873 domain-containing protein [Mycobacterium sp. 94-17]MEB4211905.1 DUF4873 domain-containing protein [Mycobacterium sp. 94-17]